MGTLESTTTNPLPEFGRKRRQVRNFQCLEPQGVCSGEARQGWGPPIPNVGPRKMGNPYISPIVRGVFMGKLSPRIPRKRTPIFIPWYSTRTLERGPHPSLTSLDLSGGFPHWVGELGPHQVRSRVLEGKSSWANYNDVSRRVVTLNGGLIRELPQNPRNIQV